MKETSSLLSDGSDVDLTTHPQAADDTWVSNNYHHRLRRRASLGHLFIFTGSIDHCSFNLIDHHHFNCKIVKFKYVC